MFYKIYQNQNVKAVDYINWAFSMLENNCSSFSLNILSSLREPLNIFEVEDYFGRALSELELQEPSYEECARYYILHLSEKILQDKNNAVDIVYDINTVIRDIDYPEDLEEWFIISDMIDEFHYGGNNFKLTKDELIATIMNEAKSQLKNNKKN
ncbi:hypothetical protein FJQ98_21165 [Lysinibacillus agricola]|uniref:Immunity protein 30 domain-containing protein n=1 Tax=Lysinibacillus agricola TaxID=2590012 RepID=A0ABX7APG0_9BACI|nr:MULTISPECIES: hypothetical protein [Lysinibacillus]KOS64856.1 hypothetical protein AN161_00795 [Lysinibacillus sp. FJAT-14222]QQP11669.1 hypothetical protein FJQ98_21165 [Lysinibacillus agricola]